MGFFSWLTADTGESISNRYSERGARPTYLLQPGGRPAILEPSYEGYGVFAETDAYIWLAREHFTTEQLAGLDEDALRGLGITLDMGSYYRDVNTGVNYSVFDRIHPLIQQMFGISVVHLGANYGTPLEAFGGRTGNDLLKDGTFERVDLPRPEFELKFSFSADAVYEDLPASENCPDQGFGYASDNEDEDEDDRDHLDDEDEDLDEAA